MAGLNRFYYPTKYHSRSQVVGLGIKCVFISYQKEDKDSAIKIADYLMSIGIDVYLDRYDSELKIQHQSNNPKAVTKAICNGINNSSHMLTIVSPNTLNSTWVPFEIGYGYDKTELCVLCLKGIPKGQLPEYVRAAKIIRDIYDLNFLIITLTGQTKDILEKANTVNLSASNTLSSIMDGLINDTY
nr:toll/interleukin-1 receptor domain-containing protein [uncultured Flavobacterium sp.]